MEIWLKVKEIKEIIGDQGDSTYRLTLVVVPIKSKNRAEMERQADNLGLQVTGGKLKIDISSEQAAASKRAARMLPASSSWRRIPGKGNSRFKRVADKRAGAARLFS